MKKKLLSFVLAVAMVVNLCVFLPVSAETTGSGVTFNVATDKANYKKGDTLTGTVTLTGYDDNATGIRGLELKLNVDPALFALTEVTTGALDKNEGDSWEAVRFGGTSLDTMVALYHTNGNDGLVLQKLNNNKTLFTFKATVKKDLAANQIDKDLFKFISTDVHDFEINPLPHKVVNPKVSVYVVDPIITVDGEAVADKEDTFFTGATVTADVTGISITKDGEAFEGTTLNAAGTYVITATNPAGGETEKTVTVISKVESITLPSAWDNQAVVKDVEYQNPTDNITVTYTDGTTKTVAASDAAFTFSDVDVTTTGTQTVTVTYVENGITVTSTYDVVVNDAAISAITVTPGEAKVVSGFVDSFKDYMKTAGLKVTVDFDNNVKGVDYTDQVNVAIAVNADDSSKADVTFTAGAQTKAVQIEIVEPETASINVDAPADLTVTEGMDLDLTGITATPVYQYGLEGEAVEVTADMTDYEKTTTTLGSREVTVTHDGKTATFSVNVVAKKAVSIAVTTEPDKKSYYVGEEFDATNMVVTATYDNTTTGVLTADDYTVTFDSTTAGTVKATVTYGELTAQTANLTVKEDTVKGITVKTAPTKTDYIEGQTLDLTDGVLEVTYESGKVVDVAMTAEGVTATANMDTVANDAVVTVTYETKTATFKINVAKKALASIAISKAPTQTAVLEGEELALAGLEVTATYDNEKTETITDLSKLTVTGYETTTDYAKGETTVTMTVAYTVEGVEKTATFDITVQSRDDLDTIIDFVANSIPTELPTTKAELAAVINELVMFEELSDLEKAAMTQEDADKMLKFYEDALKSITKNEIYEMYFDNNVVVSAESGNFLNWETIQAKRTNMSENMLKMVKEKYGDKSVVIENIDFTVVDTEPTTRAAFELPTIELGNVATLGFKVPDEYLDKADQLKVVSTDLLNTDAVQIKDGYAWVKANFTGTEALNLALVYAEKTTDPDPENPVVPEVKPQPDKKPVVPNTGDSTTPFAMAGVLMVLSGMAVLVLRRKNAK